MHLTCLLPYNVKKGEIGCVPIQGQDPLDPELSWIWGPSQNEHIGTKTEGTFSGPPLKATEVKIFLLKLKHVNFCTSKLTNVINQKSVL